MGNGVRIPQAPEPVLGLPEDLGLTKGLGQVVGTHNHWVDIVRMHCTSHLPCLPACDACSSSIYSVLCSVLVARAVMIKRVFKVNLCLRQYTLLSESTGRVWEHKFLWVKDLRVFLAPCRKPPTLFGTRLHRGHRWHITIGNGEQGCLLPWRIIAIIKRLDFRMMWDTGR